MNARARMILAIVGVVIICLLFFFVFVRARQGELGQIRTEIQAEVDRSVELTAQVNRLKDLQRRAPELQAELARIEELVPPEHEVPHFMFLVQDSATEAGVEFLTISPELPAPPPEGAPLAQVRLGIQAEGGYFALQDFIRRLYALDRAVRIDTVTLGGGDEGEGAGGGPITLDISVRIFLELPAAAPGTETAPTGNVPVPTAPVGTPAPGGAPETPAGETPAEGTTP